MRLNLGPGSRAWVVRVRDAQPANAPVLVLQL